MRFIHFLSIYLLANLLMAAPAPDGFFSVADVRPGMHGIGRTVFQGDKVEEFQVEILGVLANAGPKESVILARLSGGPLEHTGVLQGMSGSPVYLDGKLLGAVAMAFPFSKDPIAAIRPIGDMIRSADGDTHQRVPSVQNVAEAIQKRDFTVGFPAQAANKDTRLMNISTPLGLGGFTPRTIDAFGPQLRALGLEPAQALSAGGNSGDARLASFGDSARVQPGSMISVQLMQGDLNVGADGTVTYVDGDRIYAFGHRFMGTGATGLPFSRSEVLTLLANVNTSFKISSPRELMGVISQDRDTAVSGRFGQRASMVPLDIRVHRAGKQIDSYRMSMVNDPQLTPLLLQMAVFSTLDATERNSGAATLTVKGTIGLTGNRKIAVNDVYAGDAGVAQLASVSTAAPVAYVLQGGFETLGVERISLDIEALEKKRTLDIEEVVAAHREVRPGETIELHVVLTPDGGGDQMHTVSYTVPVGADAGPLYFTVADGNQTSMQDLKFALANTPRTPEQLLDLIGRLRSNNKAYVRVWRPEASFPTGVSELPSPPPSVALVMASSLGNGALALNAMKNSKIAEMEIDGGGFLVTGSKTIQVEVKP